MGASVAERWELYRLLSDPTRLRLLALAAAEELAVSELAELLGEGQPKVSRHATALREAALLSARKHGTWVLLMLAPEAADDPVVADALAAGTELCRADGSLDRVADVIMNRDMATREFFARGGRALSPSPPTEVSAYLRALSPLIEHKRLAIDVGTGDGALLEVLAPVFDRVIALDRSSAQLELARERALRCQYRNVRFVCGEVNGSEMREALCAEGKTRVADAVFASRVLHHAPVPHKAMATLVALARSATKTRAGGLVVVIDYLRHGDEALRAQQADLWLGFEPDELVAMAEQAGLCDIQRGQLPQAWCGDGPDRNVGWQWLAGRRATKDGRN